MSDILKQAENFEKDFLEAMGTLHTLAAKYNLPAPSVIFKPEWIAPVRCMPISVRQVSNPTECFGISIYFAELERNQTVFREIR